MFHYFRLHTHTHLIFFNLNNLFWVHGVPSTGKYKILMNYRHQIDGFLLKNISVFSEKVNINVVIT